MIFSHILHLHSPLPPTYFIYEHFLPSLLPPVCEGNLDHGGCLEASQISICVNRKTCVVTSGVKQESVSFSKLAKATEHPVLFNVSNTTAGPIFKLSDVFIW
jgi:hypothetical protein